jgi:hypothetical protein
MKTERLALPHKKICARCIQIGVLQLVMVWQHSNQYLATYINRRLNMQEMTKFAHPIELSDQELDLVAAGGNSGGDCGCKNGGSSNEQFGLVNLNNVLNHDNILSGNAVAIAVL